MSIRSIKTRLSILDITNMGFPQSDHQGLKDTTPNPSTGAPLYAPSQGVGLIDVVAQFSVNGASGGNVGIWSYLFIVRPTD